MFRANHLRGSRAEEVREAPGAEVSVRARQAGKGQELCRCELVREEPGRFGQ